MVGMGDFSMDFFSLKGKNAIVTGGNTGLGQAFSLALAKAGANVFIPSIQKDDEIVSLIEAEGAKGACLHVDLIQSGAAAKVIRSCVDAFGSVDILVNSAGLCINEKDVLSFGRKQWDLMTAINLPAPFELSYEAAKFMIPQHSGKIINICSLFHSWAAAGPPPMRPPSTDWPGSPAYSDELAEYNIQVNGIAPGYYATEITADTGATLKQTRESLTIFLPAAGASPWTSWAPWFSWPPGPPTTSTAISWWSTAATWSGKDLRPINKERRWKQPWERST